MGQLRVVTSITIIGPFKKWILIRELCDHSVDDGSGLAAGLLKRQIKTESGLFNVKFSILYVDEDLKYSLRPTFRYTIYEVEERGLESILQEVGRKIAFKIFQNDDRKLTA